MCRCINRLDDLNAQSVTGTLVFCSAVLLHIVFAVMCIRDVISCVHTRVQRLYKLCATVHWCLRHKASQYMLHSHLRHCTSATPAVRRLLSAVCITTPAFHVRSSGLFCGWLPGTHYQTIFKIQHVLLTVFVVIWKLFFSCSAVYWCVLRWRHLVNACEV